MEDFITWYLRNNLSIVFEKNGNINYLLLGVNESLQKTGSCGFLFLNKIKGKKMYN